MFKKTILITGSCGLIGSETAKFFLKKYLELLVLIIILEKNFLVQTLLLLG